MPIEPISSFETLIRSIRYDFYAGRWFNYLILSEGIRDALSGERASAYKPLAVYRRWARVSDLFFWGGLAAFTAAFVSGNFFWLWVSFLSLVVFERAGRIQRQRLVSLSAAVLKNHFPPADFRTMSLFQISEQLSRRYGVLSLVDAMSMSDNYLRKVFLVGYLLPWPNLGGSLLVFCVVYFSCKHALNSSPVYDFIRKRTSPACPRPAAG